MEVLATEDSDISAQNIKKETGTGEIPLSEVASRHVTRELETGKVLVPEPVAQRPIATSAAQVSAPLSSAEQVFRIMVSTYGKYHIGPKWYEFKPGVVYTVNATVKDILKRRKILVAI